MQKKKINMKYIKILYLYEKVFLYYYKIYNTY